MADKTKPKDSTSYKETAFGIIPREELIKKEIESVTRGLEYIISLPPDENLTPQLLLKLHAVCFGPIFPLMLRLGLPLAEVKVESDNDRKKYIAALKAADEADFSQLENLIASAIKEASS